MGPPNRGFKRGKYATRKLSQCRAIVVHTTGAGLIRRYRRESAWPEARVQETYGRTIPQFQTRSGSIPKPTPLDTALRVYSQLMDAGPHFVVDQAGNIRQTCPLYYAAWHVGSNQSYAYWAKNTIRRDRKYDWWRERYSSLESPAELAGGYLWLGGQANPNTVGIEVVPPVDDPRGIGPWSTPCWIALTQLFRKLHSALSIPLDRYHIFGHADAHPHSRTAKGLPWDPSPSQFNPQALERWLAATER